MFAKIYSRVPLGCTTVQATGIKNKHDVGHGLQEQKHIKGFMSTMYKEKRAQNWGSQLRFRHVHE